MTAHQAIHRVATMCRVLGVSPSGYYAWRHRPLSARARADVELTAKIQVIHRESRGTYGAPRIHAELIADAVPSGRKRVARLMRGAGVRGVESPEGVHDDGARPGARRAPDLVERQFTAAGPDRLWVADITYVPTWAGFLFLAVVLDAWSRRIIGWAMDTPSPDGPRPGGAGHGPDPAPPDGCHSSFGSGLPIYVGGLRPALSRGRRPALDKETWATPTTTRCARASSRHSSASSWIVQASAPRPTPGWPCSTSSKAGTTRGDGIPRSITCRP